MAWVMAEGEGRVKPLWTSLAARQQRRVALWSPVMIGCGVWLRLGAELLAPLWGVACLVVFCAAGAVLFRRAGRAAGLLVCIACGLVCLGYGAAELRRGAVSAPVLEGPFRGEVTGRVVVSDRSRSRAPRVVLDRVALAGLHPVATPGLVRLTLVDAGAAPETGTVIAVTGVLGPPSGPAAPGAFDFSRQAFFRQIGAVGYARGAVRTVGHDTQEAQLRLNRLRARIGETLRARIGGEEGAVAAALVVGDRSEISPEVTRALRDSGLAHLLAISGLHIGLMSALTYWLVRLGLALFPGFASRVPIRKIAAVAGLIAAAGYLALSGFGVATQRAFVMAAVAFGAILIDRPAVTIRGLAAAACVVLLVHPESLFGAGFQMSFAAVAALVAGYEASRPFWRRRAERRGFGARLWTGVLATLVTSVIAGAATAPFAAYHFNRLVAYGLPANLLATPAMGLWIMPAIILAAALAPFGLEGVGLWLLGAGIAYVLGVAEGTAALGGAAIPVAAGPPWALALIVFGGLWLVIWRGPVRAAGLLPMLAGIAFWGPVARPDVLISGRAELIAGRTDSGELWLSREKAASYAAETWLRRDGVGDDQPAAHARRQWRCDRRQCEGGTSHGWRIVLLRSGKPRSGDCQPRTVLVTPKTAYSADGGCTVIDAPILARASSVALFLDGGKPPRIALGEPTRLKDQ